MEQPSSILPKIGQLLAMVNCAVPYNRVFRVYDSDGQLIKRGVSNKEMFFSEGTYSHLHEPSTDVRVTWPAHESPKVEVLYYEGTGMATLKIQTPTELWEFWIFGQEL